MKHGLIRELKRRHVYRVAAAYTVERLFATPDTGDATSPAMLRLDPVYYPIRKTPQLQVMLKQYAEYRPAPVPPAAANTGTAQ